MTVQRTEDVEPIYEAAVVGVKSRRSGVGTVEAEPRSGVSDIAGVAVA